MIRIKGTSHLTIGAAGGIGVGLYTQADPLTLGLFAAVGAVSGLIPDLDTNGLASNKITLSKGLIKTPLMLMGIGIIIYSLYQSFISTTFDFQLLLSILIGGGMVVLSKIITQKRMLTLTGVGVVMGGLALNMTLWIMLLGVYILIASFLPHRSYTHTIIGLSFFAGIMHMAQTALSFDGLFLVGIVGYISHLVADMKALPVNRRGVKFFAPIWNKEF
ncbi:metal-dependent hydrolase [Sporosarcina limicola]|uniref:Inner membrane protein n=1 Tax=Sporosarcina limicola TaxID=34101 RepID=A0A927MHZ3_9BACL|nr:metal-dependent hydrolase [Sporosarcina limicola]MBE1554755.1 inner membrane protein [Sporosarcina limicola]